MMDDPIRILIVHSDSTTAEKIQKALRGDGYTAEHCSGNDEGVRLLKQHLFHVVLLDPMFAEKDRMELIHVVEKFCPDTFVLPAFHDFPPMPTEKSAPSASAELGIDAVHMTAMKMTLGRLSRGIKARAAEKENQREALKIAKELQESNWRLMELDKRKNDCLSVATHELRTPMTIVSGYMRLLLSESFGSLNQKQRHLIRESNKNCDRLIRLVNSMLERCRLDSELVKLSYEKGAYLASLDNVVGHMKTYIEESGLVLHVELPDDEVVLSFDPNAIEQILINLIANAVKFTPPPGRITVRCVTKPGGILTQVMDSGVGIEADEIGKVFDEFNRVGKKHGDKKGAGLGLSICKRIVHAHQGEIWVDSEPGKGACFSFFLPYKPVGAISE